MAITARYEGPCCLCPHPIREGDAIVKHDGGWAHYACAERDGLR